MKLIDSHAHLTALKGEWMPILERAAEAGVCAIVNIATTPQELETSLSMDADSPRLFHAAATTPHDVREQGERDFPLFEKKISELVAVGETGLDYHYTHSPKELQQHFLRRYLQLAKEYALPVIFHCREAFDDLFRIVEEENYQGKALLHCFTGSLDEAKRVVERGWMLSMSGIVTFGKSAALREVAAWTPLDHLVIETDAPYLAPGIYRGKPNEPAFLVETARCVAEQKRISLDALAEATRANAIRFFDLPL